MEGQRDLNPNKPIENSISDAEKMRSFLETEQIKLAKEFMEKQKDLPLEEQITISADFRIVPPTKTFSDTQRMAANENIFKNHKSLDPLEVRKDENKRAGFLLEMLKTSIMHKKMGKQFIVVRSSRYDDGINKVDNVIVDRNTGLTVCAFDEVSPRSMTDDKVMENKIMEVSGRNSGFMAKSEGFGSPIEIKLEQGVRLKHGISFKDGKISCKEINHLPIFWLAVDQKMLDKAIRQFKNEATSSENENDLFLYFLLIILIQIREIKTKGYANLPSDMQTRIEKFETFIEERPEIKKLELKKSGEITSTVFRKLLSRLS
ncbi:hypothetical protein A2738_03430 [Candidatus Nomurabacteria bacterium RIFCSPHIGHO2_01_FULL_42_15]|uniref:Uncharacterized protein n=1 Tax=Candidatus Nomurabacteria bacterium RIFCSPHIGHO2_01_FULL_42_15 TaxID=1801742 RepID=A0A1F6VE14_9BACT|nr:MAG: hypothetical protein A2738_03430 [Candidatus Nomurabacteria bacterium RIFCSPHIGHO2_01_FULL_42_15]OGI93244.1 MAG: hypothetical protein A3A99_03265 [Candidatus Nomurabacteria bacterium RIFCSPLOWO2_01_FULL_41_18]